VSPPSPTPCACAHMAQALGGLHLLLGLRAGRSRPYSSSDGGADAPRTLLAPLGMELLSDRFAIVNPAFESGIHFTTRHNFILGPAAAVGPEALVISTSDSLPTEESEENSSSSPAGSHSSVGLAASCQGPSQAEERGTRTPGPLPANKPSCVTTQRVQSEKYSKNRGNNSELK
jgi:hypothetical protein